MVYGSQDLIITTCNVSLLKFRWLRSSRSSLLTGSPSPWGNGGMREGKQDKVNR